MARNLISGLYSTEFYKYLLQPALAANGYETLGDHIAEAPNYWFDEEGWKKIYDLAAFPNMGRTFSQRIGGRSVPVMATYLSDEAEGPLLHADGFTKATGELPRMGRGVAFDMDAYEKLRILKRQGENVDSAVYEQLVKDEMNLVQTVHAQRTFTGYQVESLGYYVSARNTSGGVEGFRIDMHPVAANRKGCGGFALDTSSKGAKAAWDADGAKPLGDLEDMFNYGWRKRYVPRDPSKCVFRISASGWERLKASADTKARVAFWKWGPTTGSLDAYSVSDEDLRAFISADGLPAVEVVSYYGFGAVLNPKTRKVETVETEAFDPDTVVLRAAGAFGELQWKKADNMLATADSPIYYTEGGSMAIAEDDGRKGVTLQIESICAPVPYDIQNVLYLSTDEAAE